MNPLKPFKLKSAAVMMGERARQVIKFINAMLNFSVTVGNKSELKISDQNATLVLGRGLFRQSAGDPSGTTTNAPFEVLTPNAGTANWNTVQINNGRTSFQLTEEGAQTLYGSIFSSGLPLGNSNSDLTIPIPGVATAFYAWASYNTFSGTVNCYIGTDAASAVPAPDGVSWVLFPNNDRYHFLIALLIVDPIAETVTVTQFIDSHHTLISGVDFWRAMVFMGPYSGSQTYYTYQSVVIGQVADFGTKGLYIYAPGFVGPGGLWTKLADLT